MWLFTVLPACVHLFRFWNRKQNLIVALAVVILGKPWLQWHKGCLQFNANAPKDDVQQSIFITKTQLQVLYLLCSDTNMQLENHKVRACIGRSSAATNQWEPEWSWPVYMSGGPIFIRGPPTSHENGNPGVPIILWQWGPGVPNLGEHLFHRTLVSDYIFLYAPLPPAPASWAHPAHLRPGSKKKWFLHQCLNTDITGLLQLRKSDRPPHERSILVLQHDTDLIS